MVIAKLRIRQAEPIAVITRPHLLEGGIVVVVASPSGEVVVVEAVEVDGREMFQQHIM